MAGILVGGKSVIDSWKKGGTLVILALLVSGCASMHLSPLARDEITAINRQDRQAARAAVEPIAGPLTLEESIARALKYNLERRTRMMEEAIAIGQFDVSHYDMLPKLLASAGYSNRNEDLTTRSKDSVTGAPSLANPSISSDRDHTVTDLGLTWNL